MFGARFRNRQRANQIKGGLAHGGLPALQGCAVLGAPDRIHDVLPCALKEFGIDGPQIGARDMQTHLRTTIGFVLRMEQPARFIAAAGVEVFLFVGEVVVEVRIACPSDESI